VRVTVPVDMPQGVSHEGVFGTASHEAGAPMMQRMMRKSAAVPSASAALGAGKMYAPVPEQSVREEDARDDAASIGTRARRRLAPELLALLGGAGARVPVVDGRVTV
jgi:hypothetical protein